MRTILLMLFALFVLAVLAITTINARIDAVATRLHSMEHIVFGTEPTP